MIVFDIKVSLMGTEPAVWRLLRVRGDFSLRMLHLMLQLVMGWKHRHLHEFVSADRRRFSDLEGVEPQPGVLDEKQFLVSDIISEKGDKCLYLYDFGDDWVHEIVLEAVTEIGDEDEPVWCLGGGGACPPEDCGGLPGYLELLENLNDLDAVGHDEAVERLGENFDPEAFDCSAFNKLAGVMHAKPGVESASEEMDEEMQLIMDLHEFLESDAVPERAMTVMMLDGFFAALAIHPVTILPTKWLPYVWDVSGEGQQPEFASHQDAERVMGLLFTFMNSVTSQLMDENADYTPLYKIAPIESDEDEVWAAMDWANGFMLGAMIDEEVLERTFADEEGRELIAPFVIMSGYNEEESGIDQKRQDEIRAELVDELAECVLDLQEFWTPWRKEYLARNGAGRTIKAQPRVGRNEPCPCGSGKKYKQCCGK
jgi:uncharacterized protein